MKISFINQVTEASRLVNAIYDRAHDEGSEFKSTIQQAKWALDKIRDTYDEVLERDATEDSNYRPPLKEIK